MDDTTPLGDESPAACNICGNVLDTYYPADGISSRLIHPLWMGEHVDHEPDPVPMTVGAGSCDFCGDKQVVWWFYGANIITASPGEDSHAWGPIWSACDPCAGYVDRLDPQGLGRRLVKVMGAINPRVRADPRAARESWLLIHEPYIKSVYKKVRSPYATDHPNG